MNTNRPQTMQEIERRGASTLVGNGVYSWLTAGEIERLKDAIRHRYPLIRPHMQHAKMQQLASRPMVALDFIEHSERDRK